MKRKRTAKSAVAKLRVLLALIVFVVYVGLFAKSEPEALVHGPTRQNGEQVHRTTNQSLAPAGSVYEAWVARYNGPLNAYDIARAIAIDNSRNVYVWGT